MHRNTPPRFRKNLFALAAIAALTPQMPAWAVDLAQAPPSTVQPYVAPNVIISVDDTGSMNFEVGSGSAGTASYTAPNADGTWNKKAPRMNVLKYALKDVFNDTALLPDGKIRLAWQALWNNGLDSKTYKNKPDQDPAADADSVNSTTMKKNSMRPLKGGHRSNFTAFVDTLTPSGGTSLHTLMSQADAYMRQPLGANSAWALEPGNSSKATPYLGCRRNYHILMTDGRWNQGALWTAGGTLDGNATTLGGRAYPAPAGAGKNIYYDDSAGTPTSAKDSQVAAQKPETRQGPTLSDWAFNSWARPLQHLGSLTGAVQVDPAYTSAAAISDFGLDSNNKPATLDKFWDPRYDPATWPHMVTFVIGFSSDAVTWPGYAPAGSGYSTPSGTTDPKMTGPAQQVPYGYDGSFPDLVTGAKKWPSMGVANPTDEVVHALDLWHAALNGRGRFYAVNKAEDLRVAFRDIIGQINTATEPITTSVAASGFNNMRNEVGLFSVGYESKDAWRGYVAASTVLPDDTIVPKEGWGNQTTAQKLDAANITNRVILSWSDYWNGSQYKGGTPLRWNANGTSNLSTAQNALLGLTPGATGITVATNGQNVLNYIRGDKSLEGTSAAQPFRQRVSRQGDIVNSAIWYAGAPASSYALNGYGAFALANKSRTPMLYVGGNDGMLHGFSASDGSEKIAYVPNGAISSLKKLADLGFNNQHQYYVDGSPMTGDVDLGEQGRADGVAHTPDWRTMLVGTMGAGGKGYFVLDVTKPANFSDGNAPQLVLLDRTRGNGVNDPLNCTLTGMSTAEKTACQKAAEENKDIGNITATPVLDENNPMRATQITRMNNNRWAVVLGNGYNSANARPVLLVQYLDGDRELLRVAAAAVGSPNATDNGLAAPRLVDLDGDSRPDVAYAGDNRGNMWKFDLSSALSDDWKVAFNGEPLFTATGPSALGAAARNQIQPITAPPTVRANDRTKTVTTGGVQSTVAVGGMMVAFGTGRNVTKLDPNSAQVQSLYSVLDNTHYCIADIATGGGTVKRLKVNPGNGSTVCPDSTAAAPKPLGAMGPGGAKLAQQEFSSVPVGNEASAVIPKNSDNKLSAGTWSNFDGWYLDLPVTGERLLKATQFYDGSNILAVYTQVPARGTDANQDSPDESCAAVAGGEELQYRTFINIMDGLAPSIQLVDANGDGAYNTQTDQSAARVRVKEGSHTLVSGKGKNKDIDKDREIENTAPMPEQSLRPSWRQLK